MVNGHLPRLVGLREGETEREGGEGGEGEYSTHSSIKSFVNLDMNTNSNKSITITLL